MQKNRNNFSQPAQQLRRLPDGVGSELVRADKIGQSLGCGSKKERKQLWKEKGCDTCASWSSSKRREMEGLGKVLVWGNRMRRSRESNRKRKRKRKRKVEKGRAGESGKGRQVDRRKKCKSKTKGDEHGQNEIWKCLLWSLYVP